jgi:hypothetical protein
MIFRLSRLSIPRNATIGTASRFDNTMFRSQRNHLKNRKLASDPDDEARKFTKALAILVSAPEIKTMRDGPTAQQVGACSLPQHPTVTLLISYGRRQVNVPGAGDDNVFRRHFDGGQRRIGNSPRGLIGWLDR